MNHFEGPSLANNERNENNALSAQVEALLEGCTKEELKKDENLLDRRMEEMSREELLNLTIEVQQYLNGLMKSDGTDEETYGRFGTVYGAACVRLEKMDSDKL
jgi:hypothetical protein